MSVKFLILTTDGSTFQTNATNSFEAIEQLSKELNLPLEIFFNEIDFVEYEFDGKFYLKIYKTNVEEINNESKLKRFLNVKELKQIEEYEEFYGE